MPESQIKLRPIKPDDYSELVEFWKTHYEFKPHKGDDQATITRLLGKNPGICTLAEQGGKIIGTCMGTFDGRKGYIQKVAVDRSLRGNGLGVELVKTTIQNLWDAGAFQVQVNCGEDLVGFYKKAGFEVNPVVAMKVKRSK